MSTLELKSTCENWWEIDPTFSLGYISRLIGRFGTLLFGLLMVILDCGLSLSESSLWVFQTDTVSTCTFLFISSSLVGVFIICGMTLAIFWSEFRMFKDNSGNTLLSIASSLFKISSCVVFVLTLSQGIETNWLGGMYVLIQYAVACVGLMFIADICLKTYYPDCFWLWRQVSNALSLNNLRFVAFLSGTLSAYISKAIQSERLGLINYVFSSIAITAFIFVGLACALFLAKSPGWRLSSLVFLVDFARVLLIFIAAVSFASLSGNAVNFPGSTVVNEIGDTIFPVAHCGGTEEGVKKVVKAASKPQVLHPYKPNFKPPGDRWLQNSARFSRTLDTFSRALASPSISAKEQFFVDFFVDMTDPETFTDFRKRFETGPYYWHFEKHNASLASKLKVDFDKNIRGNADIGARFGFMGLPKNIDFVTALSMLRFQMTVMLEWHSLPVHTHNKTAGFPDVVIMPVSANHKFIPQNQVDYKTYPWIHVLAEIKDSTLDPKAKIRLINFLAVDLSKAQLIFILSKQAKSMSDLVPNLNNLVALSKTHDSLETLSAAKSFQLTQEKHGRLGFEHIVHSHVGKGLLTKPADVVLSSYEHNLSTQRAVTFSPDVLDRKNSREVATVELIETSEANNSDIVELGLDYQSGKASSLKSPSLLPDHFISNVTRNNIYVSGLKSVDVKATQQRSA